MCWAHYFKIVIYYLLRYFTYKKTQIDLYTLTQVHAPQTNAAKNMLPRYSFALVTDAGSVFPLLMVKVRLWGRKADPKSLDLLLCICVVGRREDGHDVNLLILRPSVLILSPANKTANSIKLTKCNI